LAGICRQLDVNGINRNDAMNKWNTLNRKPDPISNDKGIDDYNITNAGLTEAYGGMILIG
jgi:hypothetical protein